MKYRVARRSTEERTKSAQFNNSQLPLLYECLTERVGHRDALLWQTPALALTAQAFLLTIALGPDTSSLARFVSATLGAIVSLTSIQLMSKHRIYLHNDQVMLFALELEMTTEASAVDYEKQLSYLGERWNKLTIKPLKKGLITKRKSVTIWVTGLWCFAAVNVAIMVFSIFLDGGLRLTLKN